MKVTARIKEEIAMIIEDSDFGSQVGAERITAEEVLTTLVESGILEDEYELCDSEGNFDAHMDELVQAYIWGEIKKQLRA